MRDGRKEEGNMGMIQVFKLIIVGKERELTYIDILGEAETVKKPINRLVNLGYNGVEMTRSLGAVDMVVAVGLDRSQHSTFFPKAKSSGYSTYFPEHA